MPEKKNFGKAVRISQYVLALSIILLILYFSGIQNVLEIFSQINPVFIIPAIAAYLLNNILMSFRIKKILTDIDKKIRLKFVFFSHMAGMLASDFTPARSGYLFVAYALKKHGISTKSGLATITSAYIYDLFFKIIVASIGIVYIYSNIFDGGVFQTLLIAAALMAGILILYITIMYPSAGIIRFSKNIKILQKLIDLGGESKKVQKHYRYIILITIMGWIMKGFEWFFIALALNIVQISFMDALILNPFLTLFSFVPLTPAGWGIQEAGIVGLFALMGISSVYAVSFSLMTRFVEVFVDLLGIKSFFTKDLRKESLEEFYNTIDGDIDEKSYNSDLLVQKYWQQRKTEEIKNCLYIDKKDIIIDIGCGSGVQIRETGASDAKMVLGIDLNRNALKFAREKGIPNSDYILADAEHLPVRSGKVDKIICAEIIEHLISPDKMVSEIKRVLNKDGEIVITTPNEFSFWGVYEMMWDLFGRGRNYGETHLMFFSPKELRLLFSDFSRADTKTIFFVSPFVALLKSEKLLDLSQKFDVLFERANIGLSLILYAKK